MPKEIRFVTVEDIEMRADSEGDERAVEGLGIVYDREVEIWPGFFERVRKGAFSRAIDGNNPPEVKSFFNHDPSAVLSTTRSKPKLILEETDKGLRFKSPIPPTTYGNDLRVNLERKNVRGASFSFSIAEGGDIVTRDEKGDIHREITKGELYEIGPVTNPAYPTTKVGLRDAESVAKECRETLDRTDQAQIEAARADLELRKRKTRNLELEGTL